MACTNKYEIIASTLKVILIRSRPWLYVTLWAVFSLLSEMQESMCWRATWSEQPGKTAVVGVLWWIRSWTVDSYIGKLRAIFNRLGRIGFSNPLAHPCVKEYLKFVREEQAQQPLPPRQAVPLFYHKFTRLITYLRRLIAKCSVLSPLDRYLLVRDITFFDIDFYIGDRASNLVRLNADQLFRLKDRKGFLLNFMFNKTRRAGRSHPFALLRIPNVPASPVFWLNYYIAACGALGVPLHGEYLFRSSEHKKSHHPFGGSAASARLQKYLKAPCISDGETPSQLSCRNFIHPQGFGMYSRADCPVRGLAEHSNGFVLHAPLQCFCFVAAVRTGYTQSYFYKLSASPATFRPRKFAENFV